MKLINSIKNNIIKKRKAKKSERGLYIQDIELMKTMFKAGTKFKYIVDYNTKEILIVPSTEEGNTVSYRQLKPTKKEKELAERTITVSKKKALSRRHKSLSEKLLVALNLKSKIKRRKAGKLKSVIDVRDKQALSAFSGADQLDIEIFEDVIRVRGFQNVEVEDIANSQESNTIISKAKNVSKKALRKISKIIDIKPRLELKQKYEVYLRRNQLNKVAAGQLSFDFFMEESPFADDSKNDAFSGVKNVLRDVAIPLEISSLFSGAGLMDYGFKKAGFTLKFALDFEAGAVETYKHNLGDHIVQADIKKYDLKKIVKSAIMVLGSPCTAFSNSNRSDKRLKDHKDYPLILKSIEAIKENENCKIFCWENVPQILTAYQGEVLKLIKEELSDFEITAGILCAADFGDPQLRKRAFIIGSKIGKIDLPKPTVRPENYKTVGEALKGLDDSVPNQLDISKPKDPLVVERRKYVPQGRNWKVLPKYLLTDSMRPKKRKGKKPKKPSTHSTTYRRLESNKPSFSLANYRKANILPPRGLNGLSVRQVARLFSVPDHFIFLGEKMSSRQQQPVNGVPICIGMGVATTILNFVQQYNIRMGFAKPTLVTA
ncbi:DNA cytosine methyltransferase [Priestia sp. SB1]|uniref:DNA cytosine methyltransferase n=1 Tax=Priestia sp. SB1 TaxID=3132359 RepID=UPI003179497D